MTASTKPSRGDLTRQKIMHAAERLFAAEGVEKVTLRQIAIASGQRNVSAVQYHFGSKDELLEQILAAHMGPLDERRRVLLEQGPESGAKDELESLLRVLVVPLVEKLASPSGRAYLHIQARRQPADVPMPATQRLTSKIRRALGDGAPHPMADPFAVVLLFGALSERARRVGSGRRPSTPADEADFAEALVLALAGLFRGMAWQG